jgi:hypothetical protein
MSADCARKWRCTLLTAGSASSISNDKVPHHSTFSVNRLGRFRESEILRHIFERVVAACMVAGLVKGEGFAVDASAMEKANASRYHGKAPDELDWTDAQRQRRAVAEYLAGLETEAQIQEGGDGRDGGTDGKPTAAPDRKSPKVISPSDPSSAFELIVAFVYSDQFDGLDRLAVANALGSAAADVLREAGMSHAACVTLFEALAHCERAAELDEADPEGSA